MHRILLALLLCLPISSPAADPIETRLLWRSSEIDEGVVLGDAHRMVPSAGAVHVLHGQMDVELVTIDAAGTTSRVVRIAGEAPGHVNRVSGIDVSVDGTTLAVSNAMPARTIVRSPVMPPFDRVESIDPVFDAAGFAIGVGVRVVDGAVVSYASQQPTSDLGTRIVRLVHHDLATGVATVLHEAGGPIRSGLDSRTAWTWDASPDGTVFVNDDYHTATIAAFAPGGTQHWRTEVPVRIVRKSDELIAANRESYDAHRDVLPGATMPTVLENYAAIVGMSARAEDGRLYVVSSAGRGSGLDTVEHVEWWILDTATGSVVGQESLELPEGAWVVDVIAWLGDRIYVMGEDMDRGGVPEVVCLERVR